MGQKIYYTEDLVVLEPNKIQYKIYNKTSKSHI
jgi:hypothetical protein